MVAKLSSLVIALEVFCGCAIVVVVTGNILVIEAVRRNVQLRTNSNIFITSLAVADLSVGFINFPMYMYSMTVPSKLLSDTYQKVQYSFDIYFSVSSILHLALISVDRCYAICYPVRRLTLQKATTGKILVLLWMISFIPVVLFNVYMRKYTATIITCVFFILPLMIMITSYTILGITAKLSWVKMQAHRDIKRKTMKEMRLAKTLCIVIVLFVVAWLPFFVLMVILHHPEHFPMTLSRHSLDILICFIKILHHSNSAVNPVVYAFRQKEFSNAFKQLLQCRLYNARDSVSRTSTMQTIRGQKRPEKVKIIRCNQIQEANQNMIQDSSSLEANQNIQDSSSLEANQTTQNSQEAHL